MSSWQPFGACWDPWGAPVELFGALWTTLGVPGRDFRASRGPFGVHLGSDWGVFGVILDVKLREWPRSAKRLCPGVIFELFGVYF